MKIDLEFEGSDGEARARRRAKREYFQNYALTRPIKARRGAYLFADVGVRYRLTSAYILLSPKIVGTLHYKMGINLHERPQYTMWSVWADGVLSIHIDHNGGAALNSVSSRHKPKKDQYLLYSIGDTRKLAFILLLDQTSNAVPGKRKLFRALVGTTEGRNGNPILVVTPRWDLMGDHYIYMNEARNPRASYLSESVTGACQVTEAQVLEGLARQEPQLSGFEEQTTSPTM